MKYVGGKLIRLVNDNFFNMIEDSLDQLNWLDTVGRRHKPIKLRQEPVGDDENVTPNLIVVSQEDVVSKDAEMGSGMTQHNAMFYIDIYAESRALALELAGDIKDILDGKYTSIGRDWKGFEVLDLMEATPTHLFDCEIEEVSLDRSRFFVKPHQKHWWVVTCDVVYEYWNDESE